MRPALPPLEKLPDNLKPIKFKAPSGTEDVVEDIPGVAHLDDEGNVNALEFMFELSEQDLKVLKHDPYVTLTIFADHLHVFGIQTSLPYDEKYETLNEHTHRCPDCEKFHRCDNPRHEMPENRVRLCRKCWLRNEKEREASSQL